MDSITVISVLAESRGKIDGLLRMCQRLFCLSDFKCGLCRVIKGVEATDVILRRTELVRGLFVTGFPGRRIRTEEKAAAGCQHQDEPRQALEEFQHRPQYCHF